MRFYIFVIVLMGSLFLQPSYTMGDDASAVAEQKTEVMIDNYVCKEPSDYTCSEHGGGGNCSFVMNKGNIIVYEDDIVKPKGLSFTSNLKWCEKYYATGAFDHLEWIISMELQSHIGKYGYWRQAKHAERKKNTSWEVKTDWSDWHIASGDIRDIKPRDKEGELLYVTIYSQQYNKPILGAVDLWAVGSRHFTKTIISRTDQCGVASKSPCHVCSDWSSNDPDDQSVCMGWQDYCFDHLVVESAAQYAPGYCRNGALYNNRQYQVDKTCNYEWPDLDIWRQERFTTVIDSKSSALPADGLYVFVYRRDNSFVLRKSDRPNKEERGDQGWCFIGSKQCIWKDDKGKSKNPETPCGGEQNPVFVRHSQIASDGGQDNQKVLYAGTLEIYNGQVLWLSARSGHYRPSHTGMQDTINAFKYLAHINYEIEFRDFDDPVMCIELPCLEKDVQKCTKYPCKGVPAECEGWDFDQKKPNVCGSKD